MTRTVTARYAWVAPFDLLTCLLLIFLILAITEQPKARSPRIDTLGVYAVTLSWPAGSNDDVDLYVRDPAGNIAYFGALSVGLMHLETDDLGTAVTGTQLLGSGGKVVVRANVERTVITGATPGEYVVNVQMYNKAVHKSTPIDVKLWRLRGNDMIVAERHLTLTHTSQVVTPFRFTLDPAGNVTRTSHLPKDIVNGYGY